VRIGFKIGKVRTKNMDKKRELKGKRSILNGKPSGFLEKNNISKIKRKKVRE
jgi:hypothetical protein